MTYTEAKNKALLNKIIGLAIMSLSLITLIISILKFLYFGIDNGSRILSSLVNLIKNFVEIVYQNTQFLNWFWKSAPTPELHNLSATDNFYFMIAYVIFL